MLEKEHRGFTDRCYILYTKVWVISLIIGILLVLFSGYLNISDLTPVTTLMEKTTEAMMLFTGFIVWKAKNENISKHKGWRDNNVE